MSGPYGMQHLKNQYCSNCKRKKLEDRVQGSHQYRSSMRRESLCPSPGSPAAHDRLDILPLGWGRALQPSPSSEPDVRLSPHPALQSRRWSYDSTAAFPYGTTVASRATPSSMPPLVTGAILSSLLLFLEDLHHVQSITP